VKKIGAVLLLAVVACGKRGDPKPPVPVIPQATSDLVVTQRGPHIVLAWSYPSLTTAGKSLGTVRHVNVYRYSESLPVPPGGRDPKAMLPGDIDPLLPRAIGEFSKVPPPTAAQFNKLKTRIDSIEGAKLPESTVGAKLVYEDAPPMHSEDGRPVRLTYSVSTGGASATGALSNLAIIVPLDVPNPPAKLTATVKPEGVVLAWEKADKAVFGYNIYRSAAGASFDDLAVPFNTAAVTATTYTDVPPYGKWDYRVTALAASGPPRVESDLSPPVTVTFKDLLPPPPPTGLTVLVEPKAVRLVWDAVEAADLGAYLVYRNEGPHRLQLTPSGIPQTFFRDISTEPGVTYTYEVAAVDKAGNASATAKSEPVVVPKTP
jgi:hypothetical protein